MASGAGEQHWVHSTTGSKLHQLDAGAKRGTACFHGVDTAGFHAAALP